MIKFILDFFPIVLFFIVYKTQSLHFYQNEGIHSAIIAMGIAMVFQVIITRMRMQKFEKAQLIGLILLIVFGGATIYINNPVFIMWKVSVLYVVFAAIMMGSLWIGKQTLLQRMLGKEIDLATEVWRQITWLWSVGFAVIAFINGYYYVLPSIRANSACAATAGEQLCLVAQQAEESWVNFKLFGTMGLTLILIVISVILISKHSKHSKQKQ